MLMISKQFISYPNQQHQQWNRVNLSEILKLFEIAICIHQIDLLLSRIDDRAFFVKSLFIGFVFFFMIFY